LLEECGLLSESAVRANMIQRDPVKICRQLQAIPSGCGVSVKFTAGGADLAEDILAEEPVHRVCQIGGLHNRANREVSHASSLR